MFDRLEAMEKRFAQLEEDMARPDVAGDARRFRDVAKEHRSLEAAVRLFREFKAKRTARDEAKELVAGDDADLAQLAGDELAELEPALADLESRLKRELLPKDPLDEKNILIEIRAGTGGGEASLFASDLYRMYTRFAEGRGWRHELLSLAETEVGGFREVVFSVTGDRVYSVMKYESGVHRVQRVPATETQGRIHTSTATVAVLPEADEIDLDIAEADLRIDTFCASGPGGQSVNTTKSAVRVTHVPTGLVVSCQDEKSQIKNRSKAMKVLRARLLALETEKAEAARSATRRGQIGTGDRSERIRTYNFPQGRVSDHRINLTLYSLPQVIQGDLDALVTALHHADEEAALKALAPCPGPAAPRPPPGCCGRRWPAWQPGGSRTPRSTPRCCWRRLPA